MVLASMTGFARVAGSADGMSWVWEARSVNGRGLDIRFRLPAGIERLEAGMRQTAKARLGRGNLQISLNVETDSSNQRVTLNRDLIKALMAEAAALKEELGADISEDQAKLSIEALLPLRGVLEIGDNTADLAGGDHDAAVVKGFDSLLADLVGSRQSEGAKLETVLRNQLNAMMTGVEAAIALQPECQQLARDRLTSQIEDLTSRALTLDEGRLEQELAFLLVKSDVTEEVDRLQAHIKSGFELLDTGGTMGRKLDFLVQELNRETNTLCAKSSHMGLTKIGLDMKATVDQFREQALNVE